MSDQAQEGVGEQLARRWHDVIMKSTPSPWLVLERGEGAWVWDVEGNEYLDFLAGIAVNALGHAHPVFLEAVAQQAARIAHVSNYFATRPQIELAERLCRLTGGSRVFFGNSGAEAIEAAIKLARLTRRPRILALENSFHGRTTGSLALTGKPALRADFEPLIPGIQHIDSELASLEAALGDDVAALVLEPIKGEAGVMPLSDEYLRAARELTRRHGALLIVDEIQTGAGRTGAWFGYQHSGITPDAVTLAKGIGGGVPIGALVTFGEASELFATGHHGSTFGGNPLATATANAVLAEVERADLVGNARRRGDELRQRVLALGSPLVAEVRGHGLLLGIGLTAPVAQRIASHALTGGLILNAPNETSIRIAPPLTIGDREISEFIDRFRAALSATQHEADGHAAAPIGDRA